MCPGAFGLTQLLLAACGLLHQTAALYTTTHPQNRFGNWFVGFGLAFVCTDARICLRLLRFGVQNGKYSIYPEGEPFGAYIR